MHDNIKYVFFLKSIRNVAVKCIFVNVVRKLRCSDVRRQQVNLSYVDDQYKFAFEPPAAVYEWRIVGEKTVN